MFRALSSIIAPAVHTLGSFSDRIALDSVGTALAIVVSNGYSIRALEIHSLASWSNEKERKSSGHRAPQDGAKCLLLAENCALLVKYV